MTDEEAREITDRALMDFSDPTLKEAFERTITLAIPIHQRSVLHDVIKAVKKIQSDYWR